MAPKKRARTASSSQLAGTAPKLTLRGGVPHHPSRVALWRDERLTRWRYSPPRGAHYSDNEL